MTKQLLMLTSITYAMKSKQILAKHSISSEIQRTPKNKSSTGCSYSLYVPQNIDTAEKILREHGIKILGRIDKSDVI